MKYKPLNSKGADWPANREAKLKTSQKYFIDDMMMQMGFLVLKDVGLRISRVLGFIVEGNILVILNREFLSQLRENANRKELEDLFAFWVSREHYNIGQGQDTSLKFD
jgi:hypothetical protein